MMLHIYALLQNSAGRSVLGWIERFLHEVKIALLRLFHLAADNMVVVVIIVAVMGLFLLRPPHTPR